MNTSLFFRITPAQRILIMIALALLTNAVTVKAERTKVETAADLPYTIAFLRKDWKRVLDLGERVRAARNKRADHLSIAFLPVK